MLKEFKATIEERVSGHNRDVRINYYVMLVFIMVHKKVFNKIIKTSKLVEQMIEVVEKRMEEERMPKNARLIREVYKKEVLGVIEDWERSGFVKTKIDAVIKDIMFLNQTARIRLAPLLK